MKRFPILFVVLVAFIMIFNRLNQGTLVFDDCYYGQKAKEMLREKSYFVPIYNDKMDIQDGKPILYYLILILNGKIFEFNNFSMRLGPAVAGFFGILFTFYFVKKYFGANMGFWASVVLIFTQQYLRHSRTAQPDIIFTLFFTMAMYSFYKARRKESNIFFYLLGIFTGLAVMTRNVPGFFVYGIIFVYILISREYWIVCNFHFYGGIVSSFLVILPWYIWMILRYGNNFIQAYFGILFKLGFQGGNIHTPWHIIIDTILGTYWPWLPFLLYGIFKEIKNLIKNKLSTEGNRLTLLIIIWLTVPFLIFQTAKVKGTQWIMPIYVPFAILVGKVINEMKSRAKWERGLVTFIGIVTILYLIFPIAPRTMDGGHYGELMGLSDTIKNIDGDIFVLGKNYWYFSNGIRFYFDRNVVNKNLEDILNFVNERKKFYFVCFRNDFLKLFEMVEDKRKIKTLSHKGNIVVITN